MTFVPPPPPPLPTGGTAPRARAANDRRVMWIVLAAVGAFLGVPFVLGIVAAIVIPGVMRARMSANEATAIAALRAMASSQHAAPSEAPARDERSGYEYRFVRWSPRSFTYWASPAIPDSTGTRRFCVDEAGVVRQYLLDHAWTDPAPPETRCPTSGVPVR